MTVKIRPATDEDDAACGEIVGSAASSAVYAGRLPHASALFADTSPLPRAGNTRLIAEIDGQPVGFADHRENGHIQYLFVRPEAQGHGAGAALINAVAARAGPVSVHVLALNDVGIAWYLRRGFKVVDGWVEPVQDVDAVWLRLVRDSPVT